MKIREELGKEKGRGGKVEGRERESWTEKERSGGREEGWKEGRRRGKEGR